MIEGTTKSGFRFTVREDLGDDFRFILAYAKVNSADAGEQTSGAVELVKAVLGEDGLRALCAHVAQEDGYIPTSAVMAELREIIAAATDRSGDLKN